MSRFMMVYRGEATDMADMSQDEAAAVMAKWGEWMGKVGPAMVDMGTPFGPGASMVDDGTSGTAVSLTGYSIVEAADMAAAQALADGHPYLSEGKGDYAIDLFEMQPIPMMD